MGTSGSKPHGAGLFKPDDNMYCQQHPKEKIQLYCSDCKTVACLMCYVKIHNKHECTDISEAAEKLSDLIKEDISKVETCTLEVDDYWKK